MSKLLTLGALGAGYVLGSRAGRERYEQIKTQATRLWQSPKVQQAKSDAGEAVKEQAPVVKDKVVDAAHKAAGTVGSAVSRDSDQDSASGAGSSTGGGSSHA